MDEPAIRVDALCTLGAAASTGNEHVCGSVRQSVGRKRICSLVAIQPVDDAAMDVAENFGTVRAPAFE